MIETEANVWACVSTEQGLPPSCPPQVRSMSLCHSSYAIDRNSSVSDRAGEAVRVSAHSDRHVGVGGVVWDTWCVSDAAPITTDLSSINPNVLVFDFELMFSVLFGWCEICCIVLFVCVSMFLQSCIDVCSNDCVNVWSGFVLAGFFACLLVWLPKPFFSSSLLLHEAQLSFWVFGIQPNNVLMILEHVWYFLEFSHLRDGSTCWCLYDTYDKHTLKKSHLLQAYIQWWMLALLKLSQQDMASLKFFYHYMIDKNCHRHDTIGLCFQNVCPWCVPSL